eukprot:Gb_29096 [translate_table: standard]
MHTTSSATLKSLSKPIEKQHVDDAMGEFFYANDNASNELLPILLLIAWIYYCMIWANCLGTHARKELLRPCDARFATYYIMLKRVVEEKASLRLIMCNNEWDESPLSKTSKGKLVEEIILSNNFWDSVERVLNMCEPIVEIVEI